MKQKKHYIRILKGLLKMIKMGLAVFGIMAVSPFVLCAGISSSGGSKAHIGGIFSRASNPCDKVAPCDKVVLPEDVKNSVLKLRTKLIEESRKNFSAYERDCKKFLETIEELMGKYEDFELKEIFIEGVLASFPRDGIAIGLKRYADRIKESGDGEYEIRRRRLDQAIAGCDDILRTLDGDKDNKIKKRSEKETSVKLQKAELLMFLWLVKNVERHKGGRVGGFPDDNGDLGVSDREMALELVGKELWKVSEAQALVNQCVKVLKDDSWRFNWIYFHGKSRFCHDSLDDEAKVILGKNRGLR